MKCQQCSDAEATVHLKEVTEGKLKELHLCESCATEKGFHLVVEHNKLTIATQFIWMAENLYPETSSKVGAVQCPSCGLRYSQFSRVGRVGCAECYDAFHPQLQKILLRVHGATRHKGRVPAIVPGPSGESGAIASEAVATTTESQGTDPAAGSQPNVPVSLGEEARTRLQELEARLRQAVSSEAYEEAARLRDEIRRLQGGGQ
jgi:protein arginine kinase activator